MQDLRRCAFFENFNEKQFQLLSSCSVKHDYTKGSVLFNENDMPKSLLFLTQGDVKVYKTDQKNNEILMHMFHEGSMIAEMTVLENIPYPASAVFETDGSVIEIDFDKFKEAFFTNAQTALLFFKSLSRKIKYLENVIALNASLDATARVAKFLCHNEEIFNTLTQEQLTQELHMSKETLSHTFEKLILLKLIEKDNDGYRITNMIGLQALCE